MNRFNRIWSFSVQRRLSTIFILALVLAAGIIAIRSRVGTAFAVPILTSTKADQLLIDGDSDSFADPGDTLRYTVTLTNSGDMDASTVSFSDTIDTNTTLVPGSVKSSPIGRNDNYEALGNVSINVPALNGVLANDDDPDGGSLSVTAFDAVSANGGSVIVASDGGFIYNPPLGIEGLDTFTYTITDDESQSDSATVSISINEMVWFIDNGAGPGDGRLGSPFNNIGAFNAIQTGVAPNAKDGDVIYLDEGSSSYSTGILLRSDQALLGEGVSLTTELGVLGITVPTYTSPLPVAAGRPNIAPSTGNGIRLAVNNVVRGLNVGNTPGGSGVVDNGGVGNLIIDNVGISGTGGGISIVNGGALAVTLDYLVTTSSTYEGIRLVGVSGDFDVIAPVGVLSTASVPAVHIDGVPLDINITLDSVTASNAVYGILIQDTTGSFTVTGMGSVDGSGGTISNITNRGASFINAENIDLNNVAFSNAPMANAASLCDGLVNSGCNAAIHLENSTGINLTNVDITNSAQQGINGLTVTDFSLTNSTITQCGDAINEGCLRMVDLQGDADITNSELSFAAERVAQIENMNTTLTLTVTDSIFRDTQSSGTGADGLEITSDGSANTTIDIVDSSFLRNRTNGLQVFSEGTSTVSLDVTGSTFDRDTGIGIGMDLGADDTAVFNFNVVNNPLINANDGSAVNVFADGSATVQGRINDNADIQAGGCTAPSVCVSGFGIRVQANTNSNVKMEIDGNTISNIGWDAGIQVTSRLGTGRLDATINNNTVSVDASSIYDIEARAQNANTVCANVTNNAASGAGIIAFRVRTSDAASVLILQGSGGSATEIWNNNGNTPTDSVSSSHNGTLTLGGTCNTVTHPTASLTTDRSFAARQPIPRTAPADQDKTVFKMKQDLASLLASVRARIGELTAYLKEGFDTTSAYASGETVNLALGTLNPGQVVTIVFDVTVDSPFPLGVTEVCNQGLFTSATLADLFTDDPDVGGGTDPTCTLISLEDQFSIFLPLIAR